MEEIIVREVNLKPLINILKHFKFKRKSALSGEEKVCMLYVKDEMFYVFIEHSKSTLNIECSVYIKGKRLIFTILNAHLIDRKSLVENRLNLIADRIIEFGEFAQNKIIVNERK
jgi:hypothetical protein